MKVVSFFSGLGGLDKGFVDADYDSAGSACCRAGCARSGSADCCARSGCCAGSGCSHGSA